MDKVAFKNTPALIDYFKSIVISNHPNYTNQAKIYREFQPKLMERGYIIDINACCEENCNSINKYIKYKTLNTSSTFYQTVDTVKSKNRFEILLDQLTHYMTAHGTDFSSDIYVNNEKYGEMEPIQWSSYTILNAVSENDFFVQILKAIKTGIALNTELVEDMTCFILDYFEVNNMSLYNKEQLIDSINNREMIRSLRAKWKIRPKTPMSMFEYIHSFTGQTVIVKNKKQTTLMKSASNDDDLVEYMLSLNENEMKKLASVFYRFKPFFLALKENVRLSKIVNKLRKLADSCHKPMQVNPWTNYVHIISLIAPEDVAVQTEYYMNNWPITNYRLVSIMNAIILKTREVESNDPVSCRLYRIRNGAAYVDQKPNRNGSAYALGCAYYALREQLIKRLSEKKGIIKIPNNINLTCPTSEKNFVGDIPMGSYIDLGDDDMFVGIYWKNDWGARDLDLSAMLDNGCRLGWNADFDNYGITYSGDVINAPKGGTEILYRRGDHINDKDKAFSVCVDKFNGSNNATYIFFVGSHRLKNRTVSRNQFIDQNMIDYECNMTLNGISDSVVGRVVGDKFYFTNLNTGRFVSGSIAKNMYDAKTDGIAYNNTVESKVMLLDILISAGFEQYNPDIHESYDYDLSNKQTLIELFS